VVWVASYPASANVRSTARTGALGCLALALICTVISSFNIVTTRNIGIVTNFGKPVGERGAGLAMVWPWQKVSEMDAAIQLQGFDGNSFDDPGSAIKVRLGNNSAAFVEANLNWRIKPESAEHLFQDYRTFENIRQNLVDRQLQVALSKEFATFNPQIQAVVDPTRSGDGTIPATQPAPQQGADLPGIATKVKTDLQNAVGNDIEILDVRIPGIFYDRATQDRIDEFNRKVQETKNAQQDVQTATQNRLASEQRAAQPAPDLRVGIFNCINEMVKLQKDPAGCWGQIGGTPFISIPPRP
jgi:regulator of protease activity HflC (stomatin/prohibitin superfamily)